MKQNKLLLVGMLVLPILLSACGGGSSTVAKTELVNGITVPPAPDPTLNAATLAGVDSNNNGVRDDVERKIAEKLGGNTVSHQEAMLLAKTEEAAMLNPTPTAVGIHLDAVACRTSDQATRKISSEITKLTLDTKERTRAYAKAFAGASLEDCKK